MSGEGKRGDAPPAKQPRPSSTLQPALKGQRRVSGSVEAPPPAAAPREKRLCAKHVAKAVGGRCLGSGRSCLRGHRAGRPEGEMRIARQWRRRGLKRLVSGLEMVWLASSDPQDAAPCATRLRHNAPLARTILPAPGERA